MRAGFLAGAAWAEAGLAAGSILPVGGVADLAGWLGEGFCACGLAGFAVGVPEAGLAVGVPEAGFAVEVGRGADFAGSNFPVGIPPAAAAGALRGSGLFGVGVDMFQFLS